MLAPPRPSRPAGAPDYRVVRLAAEIARLCQRGRRGCATIHWVYSIEGDVGKSWLKDYMVKTYEALVVAVDKPTDVKHLILRPR